MINGRRDSAVVPIGGAPFVHPYSVDAGICSSSASSSASSMCSPSGSPSHSPTYSPLRYRRSRGPSLGEAFSPPPSSEAFTSHFHAAAAPYHSRNSEHFQAALQYSFSLHEHTRKMWEMERMSIEKAKLDSNALGLAHGDTSLSYTKRRASAAAAPAGGSNRVNSLQQESSRRSSLGSVFGVDSLLRNKRRKSKGLTKILL